MPPHASRLARVHDALETNRLVVARHTQEIERAQQHLEDAADATRSRMEAVKLLTSPDPRVDAALAALAHQAGLRLKAELVLQEKRAQLHEVKVTEPARAKAREASQRSKSVELLIGRQALARAESNKQLENKATDEHSTTKFARKHAR